MKEAIGSRSLQAEGRILYNAAKSPFCCEMISQPFCTVLWISLEVSRRDGSQTPQDEIQLCSPARITCCCELISQPFLSACEISQTPFFTCEMFLELPDIFAPTLLDLFFRYFCIISIFSLYSTTHVIP